MGFGIEIGKGAGAALLLALTGAGAAVLITALTPHGGSEVFAPGASPSSTSGPDAAAGSVIYVHILGQVQRPGLYALRDGDRAVDIVAAAGGFTPEADPVGVFLVGPQARGSNSGDITALQVSKAFGVSRPVVT